MSEFNLERGGRAPWRSKCRGVSIWGMWIDIPWGHRREPCSNLICGEKGVSHAEKIASGGCRSYGEKLVRTRMGRSHAGKSTSGCMSAGAMSKI